VSLPKGHVGQSHFANYSTASVLLNSISSGKLRILLEKMPKNRFVLKRKGKIRFYDSFKNKKGRQFFGNRFDEIVVKHCDKC